MSVYIKGMEMPTTCLSCDFHKCAGGVGDYCTLTKKKQFRFKNRPSYCPLIPVPNHGRLIDADALGDFPYNMDFCDGGEADEWIRSAPTIIPADKEDGE